MAFPHLVLSRGSWAGSSDLSLMLAPRLGGKAVPRHRTLGHVECGGLPAVRVAGLPPLRRGRPPCLTDVGRGATTGGRRSGCASSGVVECGRPVGAADHAVFAPRSAEARLGAHREFRMASPELSVNSATANPRRLVRQRSRLRLLRRIS